MSSAGSSTGTQSGSSSSSSSEDSENSQVTPGARERPPPAKEQQAVPEVTRHAVLPPQLVANLPVAFSASEMKMSARGEGTPVAYVGPDGGKLAEQVEKQQRAALKGPTAVFAAPKIEPQPWVKEFYDWLGRYTTGIARVDLTRPTPPLPDEYDGNLLFARKGGAAVGAFSQPPRLGGRNPFLQDGSFTGTVPRDSFLPTGARLKVTRSFHLWKDGEDVLKKPLIDIGGGFAVENARLKPVARIKIRDFVSFKLVPMGVIKFARSFPLANTGMAVRLLYEIPMQNIQEFWKPPARLMVRLDNCSGTGIHLSPNGVEFDERVVRLGSGLSLRAAASLKFPRQLPIDRDNDDVGIKIHRLSLKTLW